METGEADSSIVDRYRKGIDLKVFPTSPAKLQWSWRTLASYTVPNLSQYPYPSWWNTPVSYTSEQRATQERREKFVARFSQIIVGVLLATRTTHLDSRLLEQTSTPTRYVNRCLSMHPCLIIILIQLFDFVALNERQDWNVLVRTFDLENSKDARNVVIDELKGVVYVGAVDYLYALDLNNVEIIKKKVSQRVIYNDVYSGRSRSVALISRHTSHQCNVLR